ncbi:uncharacterized protein JCM6883_006022 [Sporobolomyces salmoneus]|uniref:uncharacterized protein n=1 Tax=Sporobolomyces salmoneus TaxID=183962 RepID=UPI00316F1D44
MPGLVDLPVELLLHIHILSLSSALPFLSRSFHHLFSSTSPYHKATYLLLRHPANKTLSHAIRYSVCTLEVLQTLERIMKGKKLKCPQLPRRLFSTLSPSRHCSNPDLDHLPLIRYLLEKYKASPNSHNGYPLARAVFSGDFELIRLLLDHGADPGLKEGWAVVTAIMKGSNDKAGGLSMVRALIEPDYPLPVSASSTPNGSDHEGGGGDTQGNVSDKQKKRKRDRNGESGSSPAKRARLEDRCKPTPEMLETAVKTKQWDIVDYLTKKGAIPNLDVLKLL